MEGTGKTKNIIEALLIISEEGLRLEDLQKAIDDADMRDIQNGIQTLKEEYDASGRAFNITEIAGKYRIVTRPEFMPWIGNLYQKEMERLSGPAMETLAIIAYKQPATRAEVESVRGVDVGGVLKTLLDKDLLQVKGRKDVVGKPLIYGTTEKFLKLFGLNSLDDLPTLVDFSEEDLDYAKPQENTVVENEDTAREEEASEEEAASETAQVPEEREEEPMTEASETVQAPDEAVKEGVVNEVSEVNEPGQEEVKESDNESEKPE